MSTQPPRWLEALCEFSARGLPEGDTVVGDLAEAYAERRVRTGRARAHVWYFTQTLSMMLHRMPSSARAVGLDLIHGDVTVTLRSMARRPWLGFGVVLILALATAATTAAVSLAVGTYRAAGWWSGGERTVAVWPAERLSLGQLYTLRQDTRTLEGIGAWQAGTASIESEGLPPRSVSSARISPNIFSHLAVQPSLGRGFVEADEAVGAEPVAILGHGLWQRDFGADSSVVGALIQVDGLRRRVVGVQGPGGTAPGIATQLWTPIVLDAFEEDFWPDRVYNVVATVRSGVGIEEARVDLVRAMRAVAERFSFFFPPGFGADATLDAANEPVWRPLRTPLALLLCGSLLLLLVAAIDLGNLFLGRSLERSAEFRVRTVLGAGRGRIVGQLLVEGLLWTLAGATVGFGAGSLLAGWLAALFPVGSQVAALGVGPELGAFALAVTLVAWALISGVPIVHYLRTTRTDLTPTRFGAHHTQGALVVMQAAFATALLVASGLMLKSVENLSSIPTGFTGDGVVALRLTPGLDRDEGSWATFYEALAVGLEDASGGRAVGLASALPLLDPLPEAPINTLDAPTEVAAAPHAWAHVIDPGYLDALGIGLLQGRAFERSDRADSESVVLVNEALAETLWPGQDPLGRRIAVDPHAWDSWHTVVGVVDDVRFRDLTSAGAPAFYLPLSQDDAREMYVLIAGGPDIAEAGALVRAQVRGLDAGTSIGAPIDAGRLVVDAFGAVRIMMALLSVLSLLATVLGAIGLYGALASYVTRHRVELSTRLALGAGPGRLFSSVVGTGAALTGVGMIGGSALAIAGGGLLRELLYGVSTLDPMSFGLTWLTLGGVGLVAAAVPAARAALVPPGEVLREG